MIQFTIRELVEMSNTLFSQVKRGDTSMIREMHTVTSGLKAFATWMVAESLETMRQSCGGAGFSMHSGLCHKVQDYLPMVTYEGVNVVMAQQCARGILKTVKKITEGKEAKGLSAYMNNIADLTQKKCSAQTANDFTNLDLL